MQEVRNRWRGLFLLGTVLASSAALAQTQPSMPAPPTPPAPAAAPAPEPTVTLPAKDVERMRNQLNDWAFLAGYQKDNAALPPPTRGVPRVVFMGDSITGFWGHLAGKFFPDKPNYINRGIAGQTTPQMLVRFRQDVVDLHPDVVILLAGINDIAGNTGPETLDQIENNFQSMVDIAIRAHIRVVLCSTLPAQHLNWKPEVNPTEEVKQLNAWIENYAREQHLVYCNYYPALDNGQGGMRPELAMDKTVHPNDAGYAIMAPIAEAAIAKSLEQPKP